MVLGRSLSRRVSCGRRLPRLCCITSINRQDANRFPVPRAALKDGAVQQCGAPCSEPRQTEIGPVALVLRGVSTIPLWKFLALRRVRQDRERAPRTLHLALPEGEQRRLLLELNRALVVPPLNRDEGEVELEKRVPTKLFEHRKMIQQPCTQYARSPVRRAQHEQRWRSLAGETHNGGHLRWTYRGIPGACDVLSRGTRGCSLERLHRRPHVA